MAFIGCSHSWRKHDHLVGHGKGLGKVSAARRQLLSKNEKATSINQKCVRTLFLIIDHLPSEEPRLENLRSRDHRLWHWRAGSKLEHACCRVVCSIGRSSSLRRDMRPPRLRSEESADQRCGGDRRGDAHAWAWCHWTGAYRLA